MKLFQILSVPLQDIVLAAAIMTFLCSLIFHLNKKENLTIGLLVITAILIFWYAAALDPFLNLWDERFHALVSKNMLKHPLMPTLYDDPVVSMDYDRWDRYHIWLHKQPLFLWQIALSFKVFGVSEFSLRIPDIILGAVFVLAGYRSGKLLVNPRVGYLTGVLIISTFYFFELVSGRQEVDHNDFSFLVYVSLSIWSLLEYRNKKSVKWIILIGIFSGFAVLCKWLVGFLVYLVWLLLNLFQKKLKLVNYQGMIIAFLTTLVIVLPWQILTFYWYPKEAAQAFALNAAHFWIPVDGQRGSFWYHFEKIDAIYGFLASFIIVPSLWVLYIRGKDKALLLSLICTVISVYLFFSIAATKMTSFTIVVSIVILIAFATMIDVISEYLDQHIKTKIVMKLVFGSFVIIIVILRFNFGLLQEKHSVTNGKNLYSQMLLSNKTIFKSLNLPNNSILFNVKGRHYIEAMFYTGLPAYNFIPTIEQYDDIKLKGKRVVIMNSENLVLPGFILNDSSTIIINKVIQGNE